MIIRTLNIRINYFLIRRPSNVASTAMLMIRSITPTMTPTGALLVVGDVVIADVEATQVKNITLLL